MKRLLGAMLLGAALAGCGGHHVLRTGRLAEPRLLSRLDPEIEVDDIHAGADWTNVWIGLTVRARGGEVAFDPSEFALYVPATNVMMPASTRAAPGGVATPPTRVEQGGRLAATLLFETPRGGARPLEAVELLWRDQRLAFGGGR